MSIFKLTVSGTMVLFLGAVAHAQNCGCDAQPRIPQCPQGCGIQSPGFISAFGFNRQGCNTGGCNSGCNQNCVPASDLWAGFASNADCKGCVRCNRLKPNLPGFGGFPACNLKGCVSDCRNMISMPSLSANWPRPFHMPNAACRSLKPKLQDAFNVFGCVKKKNVRCDIQDDCFGKLGESRQSFTPLPSAIQGNAPAPPKPAVDAHPVTDDIPPAPIVEPDTVTNAPSFDNAKRFEYGKPDWSR